MDKQIYENLVMDLCKHVNISEWRQVLDNRHVNVNDKVVGLIDEEAPHAEVLSIYVDLGPAFPERDPDLYRRMLAANLQRPASMSGHFGLHPQTGDITYHWRMNMRAPMTGARLAELLAFEVDAASALLAELRT